MNIDNTEVHMISITDNPVSQHFKNMVMPSWTERGYDVHHFEAITPDTLPNYLRFGIKQKYKKDFHPTEKAVWYSHAQLWAYCRDSKKNVIIVEHDVELLLDKIPKEVYNSEMACLCYTHQTGSERKHQLAGGAYFLTPRIAGYLLNSAKKTPIFFNSDAIIHHLCDKYGTWDYYKICKQNQDEAIGNTIVHVK